MTLRRARSCATGCGCGKHRRRGWWPSNVERRTITVAGVDRRAEGIYGLLDRTYGRQMAGRGGHIRTGMGSDPSYKFSGYLAIYNPVPAVGASSNLRRSPNIAFPSSNGASVLPAGVGSSVAASMRNIPPRRGRR